MKKVTISGFKTKEQYRIKFTSFIKEYGKYGLKESKELMDKMLDGEPIEIHLDEADKVLAEKELITLKMNYVIR